MKEIEIKCPKCACKEYEDPQMYYENYSINYQIFQCDNCKCKYVVRYKRIPMSIEVFDTKNVSFKLEYDSIWVK